jgi:anti-sigma B factor antagonist
MTAAHRRTMPTAMRSPQKNVKATTAHPYLAIETTSARDAHTIALSGEVDLLGVPKIEAALKDVPVDSGLIIIDLRGVTFIDSSGLHALATGQQLCLAREQELRIIPGPPNIQRLFEITGMNDVLPFCDAELVHEARLSDDSTG